MRERRRGPRSLRDVVIGPGPHVDRSIVIGPRPKSREQLEREMHEAGENISRHLEQRRRERNKVVRKYGEQLTLLGEAVLSMHRPGHNGFSYIGRGVSLPNGEARDMFAEALIGALYSRDPENRAEWLKDFLRDVDRLV